MCFESIVAGVSGRPHWGKVHTLNASRLRQLYPHFGDFVRVRDEVDPVGQFANPYLDRVLGPPPAGLVAGFPRRGPGSARRSPRSHAMEATAGEADVRSTAVRARGRRRAGTNAGPNADGFASVYLDTSGTGRGPQAKAVEIRWRDLREELSLAGVDAATLDALGDVLTGPGLTAPGTVAFGQDGTVPLAVRLPAVPLREMARWARLPDLLPLLIQSPPRPPHLLVQRDPAGGDVLAMPHRQQRHPATRPGDRLARPQNQVGWLGAAGAPAGGRGSVGDQRQGTRRHGGERGRW